MEPLQGLGSEKKFSDGSKLSVTDASGSWERLVISMPNGFKINIDVDFDENREDYSLEEGDIEDFVDEGSLKRINYHQTKNLPGSFQAAINSGIKNNIPEEIKKFIDMQIESDEKDYNSAFDD